MNLHDAQSLVIWIARWFVYGLAIVLLFQLPTDDSDLSWSERSGMRPRTDHRTGCQYLESSSGYLTPRLDGHGKQVGCWQGEIER